VVMAAGGTGRKAEIVRVGGCLWRRRGRILVWAREGRLAGVPPNSAKHHKKTRAGAGLKRPEDPRPDHSGSMLGAKRALRIPRSGRPGTVFQDVAISGGCRRVATANAICARPAASPRVTPTCHATV